MSAHELPLKEWIVIFYPQTGVTRLCPTLDYAKNAVGSSPSAMRYVYKSALEFQQRHDHVSLEGFWRSIHKHASWAKSKSAVGSVSDYSNVPPDTDTESFCKRLWEFIQDVGDRLSAPRISTDKTKEHYELKVGLMRDLIQDEESFKERYNKQARTVFEALFNSGRQFLTEEEIRKLIYRLVAERALKTKQEPWVIFQYYRPQFIKDGFIIRGRQPKSTRV